MADENTDLRCYLTNAGIAAENNSIQLNRSLNVVEMVFGSGLLPEASDPRAQTAMISEVYAVPCAMLFDAESPTLLVFKGDLPADVGGFHINEVGIRLEDGTIYGYARGKGDYKPTLEQGATDSVRYAIEMYTENADIVVAKIDLSTVYVDWEDLDVRIAAHKAEEDPHTQYEHKNNAATDNDIDNQAVTDKHIKLPQFWRALAPSRLIDSLWLGFAARIFPVGAAIPWYTDTAPSGFAMMKGQAFNKATYPQLAAVFPTGVLPDMRGRAAVGKFDGETVGAFEQGEIKSHNHSGSVTSTDLGTKTTSTNWHDHNLKTNTNPWGDAFAASWIGDNNWLMQGFKGAIGNIATQYANARNSIDSEAHNHTVAIGVHGHGLAINANGGSRNTVDNIKVNWIVRLA